MNWIKVYTIAIAFALTSSHCWAKRDNKYCCGCDDTGLDLLKEAGFTKTGIKKDSVAADLTSVVGKTGSGQGVVSILQSIVAEKDRFSQCWADDGREYCSGCDDSLIGLLEEAGFTKEGTRKGSLAEDMTSVADKTGYGKDVVSMLQSIATGNGHCKCH